MSWWTMTAAKKSVSNGSSDNKKKETKTRLDVWFLKKLLL